MIEEQLTGGNTHDAVVRVGDTVRRPTGPWTPAVHTLLRQLEHAGFAGAPRVRGIDGQGREILDYVDGVVVHPDHDELVHASDDALAEVARLIRAYHDMVAGLPLPAGPFHESGLDPVGPAELLCHNDLGAWNLVRRPDSTWAFIDWDLVGPGRRAWDISWALLSLVPLMPHTPTGDEVVARRLAVFRDAYGGDLFPADAVAVAIERCDQESRRIRELGVAGLAPYDRLLAEGHADTWEAAAGHVRDRLSTWSAAV